MGSTLMGPPMWKIGPHRRSEVGEVVEIGEVGDEEAEMALVAINGTSTFTLFHPSYLRCVLCGGGTLLQLIGVYSFVILGGLGSKCRKDDFSPIFLLGYLWIKCEGREDTVQ